MTHHRFVLCQFWESEVLKLRCQQSHVSLEALGENPPHLFWLPEAPCVPRLVVPTSQLSDLCLIVPSSSLTLTLLPASGGPL